MVQHPGRILMDKFIIPNDLTMADVSRLSGLFTSHVSDIVMGKRGVTAKSALGFAKCFKDSDAKYWLNLQADYDLALEKEKLKLNTKKVSFKKSYQTVAYA